MIEIPAISTLLPEEHRLSNGRKLYAFPSSTELVKLDLLFEAGTAYQTLKLSAGAANRLYVTASEAMDAAQLSEFLDYRGIIVDSNADALRCSTSFYTLHRHLDDLLPVVDDLVHRPSFPQGELEVFKNKRRQELMALRQKSHEVARRLFYESLFGREHPLGRYADVPDVDLLTRESVKAFYDRYHRVGDMTIVVSGKVDDRLLAALDERFGHECPSEEVPHMVFSPSQSLCHPAAESHIVKPVSGSVQTTVRVGRVLPLAWESADYARFMILTTLLGGYFGSRLMQNLREDKGYTYGIYARTQLYRGVIVFYITADVAGSVAKEAEQEIIHELRRLAEKPVGEEELNLVKVVLAGDFIRSVDGIFERSARFCDMLGTDITEQFTENLRTALNETTAEQLRELAQRLLNPDDMTVCLAGAV